VVARAIHGLRARAYRHFAAAQQSAEEESFEWSAAATDSPARDRFLRAIAEAQTVFLTQLALASQRGTVAPASLPQPLVAAMLRFDERAGDYLDRIADRASGSSSGEIQDPRGPLTELAALAHRERSAIANREWRLQVEGRLALYRELVPRLERLTAAVIG